MSPDEAAEGAVKPRLSRAPRVSQAYPTFSEMLLKNQETNIAMEKLSFLFVLLTKILEVITKYNLNNAEMHVFFSKAAFEKSTTAINTE